MTRDDAPRFAARLAATRTVLDRPTDAAVGEVYFGALEDYGIEEVLAALNAAAKNCERFPSPAELLANIRTARVHAARVKSTREALSEGPGEPIALPPGFGPQAMAPAKPVKRIEPTAAPRPPAVTTERQRRAGETWDQSMDRLRRQRDDYGV